jgi:hypothetical protein
MSERSEPRVTPLRLVLDFGETVELDGSTLYDFTSGPAVPAVVLRMPPHRAAYIGKVLDAYTRVCRLAGTELPADERGTATCSEQPPSPVSSTRPRVRHGHQPPAHGAWRPPRSCKPQSTWTT